jgi:hypothetical protein
MKKRQKPTPTPAPEPQQRGDVNKDKVRLRIKMRLELKEYLRTTTIPASTLKYLVQKYGGQIKTMQEWQAVVDGIQNNPVS